MTAASGSLEEKLEEAWRRHRATCLWNLRRPRDGGDLSSIVSALRANGNMDAWRLAAEIEALAPRAGRGAR